jgi:hypothetical protein
MNNNAVLVEKNTEEINSFVSGLTGPGYQMAIMNRFPLAQLTFAPADKLPYVGEGKVWVCDCGCGERDPVLVPYVTMSIIGVEGLQAARVEGIWVSPCTLPGLEPEDGLRHYGMDLWDNETDDLADPKVRLEGN